jgi:UrcA family protein
MKTIIAMTAAAVLGLSAAHAAAQTDDAPKATVSYADLDLSSVPGRAALERRIERAVDRVCPEQPAPFQLGEQKAFRACHASALDKAKAQLAEIYAGRRFAEAAVVVRGAAN